MEYNDIFTNFIVMILILLATSIIIIKSYLHIILTTTIDNKNIIIKLNIRYLFNIIDINIPIYPQKNKKRVAKKANSIKTKQNNKSKINKRAIEIKDIKNVISLIKKIDIEEIYSDISIGNENINFTCFIYVFINIIYSNIINLVKSEKVYLNINNDFTKNYITSNIKIYIKPTIKNIIDISIALAKIYKKIKISEGEGENSEVSRANTKSYGKNI